MGRGPQGKCRMFGGLSEAFPGWINIKRCTETSRVSLGGTELTLDRTDGVPHNPKLSMSIQGGDQGCGLLSTNQGIRG